MNDNKKKILSLIKKVALAKQDRLPNIIKFRFIIDSKLTHYWVKCECTMTLLGPNDLTLDGFYDLWTIQLTGKRMMCRYIWLHAVSRT